eukprot:23403-Eustigmatos_ZCMA.PRE.1
MRWWDGLRWSSACWKVSMRRPCGEVYGIEALGAARKGRQRNTVIEHKSPSPGRGRRLHRDKACFFDLNSGLSRIEYIP